MSANEYRIVATVWPILILFLTLFWFFTLRRLSVVLKDQITRMRLRRPISGVSGMFLFIFRGEFEQTRDERLVAVCRRLRSLLYGYVGSIAAYIVFLAIFGAHY